MLVESVRSKLAFGGQEMEENLKRLAKIDSGDIIYKELKELVK